MTSVLWALLADPTTISLLAIAVCTAAYASYRANESLIRQLSLSEQRHSQSLSDLLINEQYSTLEGSMALAFPIIATVSIVFLFFFLQSVGVILTLLSAISAFFSLLFLIWPAADFIASKLRLALSAARTPHFLHLFIAVPIVSFIILVWLFTGHWLVNNIIASSLCIFFASLCKVSSLRVTSILFAGLFVYDVFFVFFSELVFGQNVMVQVATSTPRNPASAIAAFFGLPFSPVQNLAMPAKLIIPAANNHQAILGLGDIILPEMLLVYLLEFDLLHPNSRCVMFGYFSRALVAYAIALNLSFFCNFLFRAAQPALLYIVPCLLIPTVVVGRRMGQLLMLWNGSHKQHSTPPISADEETLLRPTIHPPPSTLKEYQTPASNI